MASVAALPEGLCSINTRAEELACGMRWAGLTLDHLYGGFAGEPYEHDSERLIIIGHRPS